MQHSVKKESCEDAEADGACSDGCGKHDFHHREDAWNYHRQKLNQGYNQSRNITCKTSNCSILAVASATHSTWKLQPTVRTKTCRCTQSSLRKGDLKKKAKWGPAVFGGKGRGVRVTLADHSRQISKMFLTMIEAVTVSVFVIVIVKAMAMAVVMLSSHPSP